MLLISFQVKRDYASEGIKTRILTTNNFIKSMERDASRAVYISSYRTMVALIDYVASKKEYIQNDKVNEIFADALFNGSLDHSLGYEEAQGILTNSTLKDWQNRTIILASATDLEINFTEINPEDLVVTQTDPWNIVVSIPVQYNLTDPISKVSWIRNTRINTSIPITNFEDPLYVVEFGPGCGTKIVNGENLRPLVGQPVDCDISNLSVFIATSQTGSRYLASNISPSYLDRLTGNLSGYRDGTWENKNIGITSLVNVASPTCELPYNTTSSVVDFKYGRASGTNIIKGIGWIRLDDNDVSEKEYNISSGCY